VKGRNRGHVKTKTNRCVEADPAELRERGLRILAHIVAEAYLDTIQREAAVKLERDEEVTP